LVSKIQIFGRIRFNAQILVQDLCIKPDPAGTRGMKLTAGGGGCEGDQCAPSSTEADQTLAPNVTWVHDVVA
jgi:hypothetical protein